MMERLEDLDFANYICMLSPRFSDIEDKLEDVDAAAQERKSRTSTSSPT